MGRLAPRFLFIKNTQNLPAQSIEENNCFWIAQHSYVPIALCHNFVFPGRDNEGATASFDTARL